MKNRETQEYNGLNIHRLEDVILVLDEEGIMIEIFKTIKEAKQYVDYIIQKI